MGKGSGRDRRQGSALHPPETAFLKGPFILSKNFKFGFVGVFEAFKFGFVGKFVYVFGDVVS